MCHVKVIKYMFKGRNRELQWKREIIVNWRVVASLKTLLSGWLNKYSNKFGMNSNSVYYNRFYLSWIQ